MRDNLAFLPVDAVLDGMAWLKTIAPPAAAAVVAYFDETYVLRNGQSTPAADVAVRHRRASRRTVECK